MAARALIFYITNNSGHHRASMAMERAVHKLAPGSKTLLVDANRYFHPILTRLLDRTYMSVIHKAPEIWEHMYDNTDLARRFRSLGMFVYRHNTPKITRLLDEFRPTVIACTQAFPCGSVADYKERHGLKVPLYGVLTDFMPHHYWLHQHHQVNGYMVGSEEARMYLSERGVPEEKVHVTGIPVDPVFAENGDRAQEVQELKGLDPKVPMVLVMGGGQGLGPIEEVVVGLNRLPQVFQLVVVTGTNAQLKERLTNRSDEFKRQTVVLGHVSFVHQLMDQADLVITKPGGLTVTESLAKKVPLVLVKPIPGQEAKNSRVLVDRHAAVQADHWNDVPSLVGDLLSFPEHLRPLQEATAQLSRPRSALEIAKTLLKDST